MLKNAREKLAVVTMLSNQVLTGREWKILFDSLGVSFGYTLLNDEKYYSIQSLRVSPK